MPLGVDWLTKKRGRKWKCYYSQHAGEGLEPSNFLQFLWLDTFFKRLSNDILGIPPAQECKVAHLKVFTNFEWLRIWPRV